MIVFDIMCQRYVPGLQPKWFPLVAVSLCVAAAVCLDGCGTTTGTRQDQDSRVALTAFLDKLESNAERLAKLDSQSHEEPLAVSPESRQTIQGSVAGFRQGYTEYRDLLDELSKNWNGITVARLRVELQRCENIAGRLAEESETLSRAVDGATIDSEAIQTGCASSGAGVPENLAPTRDYLAACKQTTRLTTSVNEYLGEVHAKALGGGVADGGFGAGVFHFLRLHQLGAPQVENFALRYKASWKKWIEWQINRKRPDEAMAVFALVSSAAPDFRPTTLQSLFDITNGCLEKAPMLEVVQGMYDAFERIEAVYGAGDVSGDQRRQLIQTKGTLLFCHARLMEDDRNASIMIANAVNLNPHLGDHVTRSLLRRARRAAQKRVVKHEFSGAVSTFRTIVSSGPVRNATAATRRYRDEIVSSAIAKAEKEIRDNRFAAARLILTRVTKVAGTSLNRRKLTESFKKYYRAYSNYVLQRDVGRGLQITREALGVFPQDAALKGQFDRGILLRLKTDVGDLGTSFERLSPPKILEMLRETVSEMRMNESANMCHAFKREIEAAWDRRARNEDSGFAFELAVGIAQLGGKNEEEARRDGARSLVDLFNSAVAKRQWEKAEQCVEAWFASCSDIERPDSFKWNYVRLIDHLETTNDVKRLGRHLAIFTKVYASEAGRYRTTIAKYVGIDSEEGLGFYALLKTIAPESAEVRAIESEPTAPNAAGDGLTAFMEEEELQETGDWWSEPIPTTGDGSSEQVAAVAAPSFAASFGDMSIAGGVVGGIGSLALTAALVNRRSRRRPVSFSWYAAVALAVGLTVGFVVGARETGTVEAASTPAGTAAEVSQNE